MLKMWLPWLGYRLVVKSLPRISPSAGKGGVWVGVMAQKVKHLQEKHTHGDWRWDPHTHIRRSLITSALETEDLRAPVHFNGTCLLHHTEALHFLSIIKVGIQES